MSILVDKLRATLFSNLRPDMPQKIREVAWDLFNAIDNDLDVANFIPSSSTDEVIELFDAVMRSNELPDFEDEEVEDDSDDTPTSRFAITDDELTDSAD